MARYFLHLHHSGTVVHDEEGIERETDDQARLVGLMTARELIGADALNGVLMLDARIDIADPSGGVLDSIRFKEEAVTMVD